jgi:hypothetical protein
MVSLRRGKKTAAKKTSNKVVAPAAPGFVPTINKGGTSKESPGAVNNKEDQAFPGTEDRQKGK